MLNGLFRTTLHEHLWPLHWYLRVLHRSLTLLSWEECRISVLGGFHELSEFFEVDFSISISIESPDNRNENVFIGNEPAFSEEPFEVCMVEVRVVPVINTFESIYHWKIIRTLKDSFELVDISLELSLSYKQLSQSFFDSHRKKVMSAHFLVRSLRCGSSEDSVFARQEHLEETITKSYQSSILTRGSPASCRRPSQSTLSITSSLPSCTPCTRFPWRTRWVWWQWGSQRGLSQFFWRPRKVRSQGAWPTSVWVFLSGFRLLRNIKAHLSTSAEYQCQTLSV